MQAERFEAEHVSIRAPSFDDAERLCNPKRQHSTLSHLSFMGAAVCLERFEIGGRRGRSRPGQGGEESLSIRFNCRPTQV